MFSTMLSERSRTLGRRSRLKHRLESVNPKQSELKREGGMAGEGMRWEKRWSPTDGRSCPRASEKSEHSLQVPNKLASPGSPLLGPSATWIREALSFNLILTRDHCQARDLTFSLWPSLPWILQAFRMSSRTAKATQANPGGGGGENKVKLVL